MYPRDDWLSVIPLASAACFRYSDLLISPTAMAGPRPVVFSGPSGAGKSTLLKKLMKEYESVFGFSVSRKLSSPLYDTWL